MNLSKYYNGTLTGAAADNHNTFITICYYSRIFPVETLGNVSIIDTEILGKAEKFLDFVEAYVKSDKGEIEPLLKHRLKERSDGIHALLVRNGQETKVPGAEEDG